MDAVQEIVANNDRMFRELFGIDVGLHDLTVRVADARGLVVQDHSALCIAAGICTCRLPIEEEVEAAR